MAGETATKRNPKLWEEAKEKAREQLGGHSARAMQLAVKLYKDAGGQYEGRKSSSNRLAQWTKEDWQTREEFEEKR
jgi:hypothetical protein